MNRRRVEGGGGLGFAAAVFGGFLLGASDGWSGGGADTPGLAPVFSTSGMMLRWRRQNC